MKFTRSTIRCSATGLTEEQARQSLYQSGRIQPGDEVGPLVEQSGFWTASVFSPAPKTKKTASPPFPPDNDNEETDSLPKPKSEAPDDSPPDSEGDGGPEGKPDKPEGSKPKPKGESGDGSEVVELLHQILNLLAPAGPIGPGAGGPMAPPGAGGPPPGGPPPGPAGPPPGLPPGAGGPAAPNHRIQEVIHKRVMKPGEAAPGQTPIGAPALASVPISSLGHMTAVTSGEGISLSQAKDNLTASYAPHGYKVEQIKRVAATNEIAALLVKHA